MLPYIESVNESSQLSFIHSFIHSLDYSFLYWCFFLLTQTFIYSSIQSYLIHSFIHPFIPSFLNRSFVLQNFRIARKSGIIFSAYHSMLKYDSASLCNPSFFYISARNLIPKFHFSIFISIFYPDLKQHAFMIMYIHIKFTQFTTYSIEDKTKTSTKKLTTRITFNKLRHLFLK